jgi:hypothetical protein
MRSAADRKVGNRACHANVSALANNGEMAVQNRKQEILGHSAFGLRPLIPRVLLLCAALLIPALATAQPFPGSIPAWYSNSPQGTLIYQDAAIQIVWNHSYVYLAPGNAALYWYAQVMYQNVGKTTLSLKCAGPVLVEADREIPQGSLYIREDMEGTPNSGYVDAAETLCIMDPSFRRILQPGEVHYDWAIFPNVPWKVEGSLASLGWGPYGFSAWADPWSSPTSRILGNVQLPAPAECPSELVSLKTCFANQPTGKMPDGQAAQNLIVLVHGCCTDEKGIYEIYSLADQIVGGILESKPTSTSEVVVWDWTQSTPPIGDPALLSSLIDVTNASLGPAAVYTLGYIKKVIAAANTAYAAAAGEGDKLAQGINCSSCAYRYIHLIGHSAGSKLR